MRRLAILSICSAVVCFNISGIVHANNEDPVIAVVGDIQIRQSELDRKIQEVPSVARAKFETKEGQLSLLERIVRSKAMMKAAEEAGYLK